MAQGPKPRPGSQRDAKPKNGRQQQRQTIPRKDLMGAAGDPAEGKRNVGSTVKR